MTFAQLQKQHRKKRKVKDPNDTDTMHLSPSKAANRSSAGHRILRAVWNPMAHYLVHKSYAPFPTFSYTNPVHVRILLLEDPFLILSTCVEILICTHDVRDRFLSEGLNEFKSQPHR